MKKISELSCYDSVKYIRKIIGYDNFIKEFCDTKKINPKWLFEILDEMQESARNFLNLNDFVLSASIYKVDLGIDTLSIFSSSFICNIFLYVL